MTRTVAPAGAGPITIGLDAGGAHLKVARLEGRLAVAATAFASPLWLGEARLAEALVAANPLMADASTVVLTMTGELSRVFAGHRDGVRRIIEIVSSGLAPGVTLKVWMGQRGIGAPAEAAQSPDDVGSTNFLASAICAARQAHNGLFIDMGSTTTDIIAFADGKPLVDTLSDAARLTSGELVYTGLTRTPVMAVADRVPIDGAWRRIANETYADMADVYRLLGRLPEAVDIEPTCDARGKSLSETAARLARMAGETLDSKPVSRWTAMAETIAERQQRLILDGILQVISRHGGTGDGTIVAAGIGAPVVAGLAHRLNRPCMTFAKSIDAPTSCSADVTHHAAAVAVATLYVTQAIT